MKLFHFRMVGKDLKVICEALDLERSGIHSALVDRIMQFCVEPKDNGKKHPKPKRKSKGGSRKSAAE